MKRITKLLFITMFFSFILINKVNAGACDNRPYECVECNYGDFSYVVYADGAGDAEIDIDASQKLTLTYANKITDEVTGTDFVNEEGDGLACPYIYQKKIVDNMQDTEEAPNFELYATWELDRGKKPKGDAIYAVTSAENNGKPFLGDEEEDEKEKKTCLFLNSDKSRKIYFRITYDGENLSFNVTPKRYEVVIPEGNFENEIKEQFKKECEDIELYMFVNDAASEMMDVTQLNITSKPTSVSGETKLKAMNNISDQKRIDDYFDNKEDSSNRHDDSFNPKKLCEDGDCDIDVSGFCNITSVISVLRFLGILLFIAKILVPLIIIGMGIYHLFMIITAGKPEEAKKQVNSIVKRVITGVIIFLLPSLVYWIFQVAGANESKYANCVNCILDLGNCDTK